MNVPLLNKLREKFTDRQKDIITLTAGYCGLTLLLMSIMSILGWYTFHIGYMLAPPVITAGFILPVAFGSFFKKHKTLSQMFLYVYGTLIVYFFTETITKYLAPNRIFCMQFVFSLLLTLGVYLLFSAIIGKFTVTFIVCNVIFAGVCLSNRVLLDVRGRPLFISDFTSLGTALNVSSSYRFPLVKFILVLLVFVFFTAFTVMLTRKLDYDIEKVNTVPRIVQAAFMIILLLVSYCTDIYKKMDIELTYWSHQNGILLDWLIESKDFTVKTPVNYSVENIEAIGETFKPADNSGNFDGLKPNIIAVMNESFSDLSVVNSFNTDIDYMPFLHAAEEGKYDDMIVGNAYASVYGGNTANSEYEFLTGDSIILYPQNAVPYQTFLDGKGEISSLVSHLKSLGYATTAMHPYWSSGWNRTNIYEYMGFDKQIYLEDMSNIEYIRNYCSDSCDYKNVIEQFENRDKSKPFFMFNVTIQNHGGYTNSSYQSTVHLTDYSGQFPQTQQYLSLVRESDKALLELIEYFRNVDEPTVIVFFGDHQPSVERAFYEKLYGKAFSTVSPEENMKMYVTKYMVWKNFETDFFELGDTSINYLSARITKMIGLPTTSYQNYLLDMREKYPIITAEGVYDKEHNFIPVENADLSFYKTIVYNHMLDNEKYKREFFENTYEVNDDYLQENYEEGN